MSDRTFWASIGRSLNINRLASWLGSRATGMKKPDALVTMRIADMTKMHPAQDDTHTCAECGHPVGIYPSGMAALRKWPKMQVLCVHCAVRRPEQIIENMAAADFETLMAERRDSYDVGRG
jgi:hypothetical protein